MESNGEITEECSLKIGTIWSEADESFLVKEEIISDIEPDPTTPTSEIQASFPQPETGSQIEEETCYNGFSDSSPPFSCQASKKKVKNKNQRNGDSELVYNKKLTCLHDTKNFKIIKRRLRCGDCRSLVCPECCKVMIPNLQSHFLGSGTCSSGTYLCKLCCIIFRSLCALQAHIRIHTMDTPYVCPDCGIIYNNIYFLILHLLNKCFHVYKIVRYKCKQCPGEYFTPETFVHHVQEKHIHCVFRCLFCSSLFSNYDEFNSHMESLHQKQKVQYLNYFRCSLCSNIVIPRFMYQRHVSQHRENSEYYEIDYRCLCGETFGLIGSFRSHYSQCDKKGILPPKWSFLQKKLRTHHENNQNKEVVIQSLPLYSQSIGADKKLPKIEDVYDEETIEDISCSNSVGPGDVVCNEMDENKKLEESKTCCNSNCKNNRSDFVSISVNQVKESCNTRTEEPPVDQLNNPDTEMCVERTNVQPGEGTGTNEFLTEENNCKESDGKISKIYDHIPCDHLGYVIKSQCPESNKRSFQEESTPEKNSESYKIVTELDEKTGFIVTKTVPLDGMETDDGCNEDGENINGDEFNIDSLNFCPGVKFCNDKPKFKMGNSINCPFCIVLFPKHNLTFQQFRLHLESYHPDAALNVTVSKEDKSSLEQLTDDVEIENAVSDSVGEVDNYTATDEPSSFEKETNTENDTSESLSASKDLVEVKHNCRINEEIGINEIAFNETMEENKSEVSLIDKSERLDEGRIEISTVYKDKEIDEKVDEQKISTMTQEENTKVDVASHSEESMETRGEVEKAHSALESGGEKNSSKTSSDFDYEIETSKDSNWSGISCKDISNEAKTEEKERSRRESEVWSEFYESLKLAEKLKKKEKPPGDCEGKRKSVVSDYSAKRVVKKPKRYRESSDSEDSNEFSDSDDEFLLENNFVGKFYAEEETNEGCGQVNKKQMLLEKLENVDREFVDYLFDLVTKKEKIFELYKKHSTLRASRYSHDLRSYRKKVLNGIKQRGRPLKIIRYREMLRKRNDKNIKDYHQSKKKSDFSPEIKKRGRPRKFHDPAKIKERRRSDREVDFIEKNFEREEGDLSPSKRKRKLSTKLQYYKKMLEEKDDFSSGQVITNKFLDSSKKFACAVCKEIFPESTEFREHIVVHRMEENTYQCMECGECFVVRPSLEKHLHAFHKIRNTDKYITDNCSIKKEADYEPLKENQCKVCKDQFDRPIDLTKHFRIHGMAFLKEFKKEGKPNKKRNA